MANRTGMLYSKPARRVVTMILIVFLLMLPYLRARAQSPRESAKHGRLMEPKQRTDSLCGVILDNVLINRRTDSVYLPVLFMGKDTVETVMWKDDKTKPFFKHTPSFFIYKEKELIEIHVVPFHKRCPVKQNA